MKILLVQSYLGGHEPLVVPLGLLCLAGSLTGHEIRIFDTNCGETPFEDLGRMVDGFRPDIIGISLRNIDSTNKTNVVFYYRYLACLLDSLPSDTQARIVVGGSGFSMFAREIMEREPRIDFGVYLEGERIFSELIAGMDRPGSVPSVFYRENAAVCFSGDAPLAPVKDLPGPLWKALGDPGPYMSNRDAFGIETKRGCALGCIYCVYGFLNGRAYRLKDPVQVADEIQSLFDTFDIRRFTFVDSIFNVPLDHAAKVCRELAGRNLPVRWSAFMSDRFIDAGFLALLERAGCDHIILSPDGYTDAVLKKLGKNIRNRDIRRAYGVLSRNKNFEISYNFFKNPPGQTLGNFLGMLLFCFRAKLSLGNRVHFEFSVMRIEPHTRLKEIAVEEGGLDPDTCLLEPVYYRNKKTRWLEWFFDRLLRVLEKRGRG